MAKGQSKKKSVAFFFLVFWRKLPVKSPFILILQPISVFQKVTALTYKKTQLGYHGARLLLHGCPDRRYPCQTGKIERTKSRNPPQTPNKRVVLTKKSSTTRLAKLVQNKIWTPRLAKLPAPKKTSDPKKNILAARFPKLLHKKPWAPRPCKTEP